MPSCSQGGIGFSRPRISLLAKSRISTDNSGMARRKDRWPKQARGRKRGALQRGTGTPNGRPIPNRLLTQARQGRFGRKMKRRALRSAGR